MKAKRILFSAVALLGTSLAASPAKAITAGDVLDKMNVDQRTGFNSGAVDMASHLFAVNGNSEKAQCAVDWFFSDGNAVREVHAFFEKYRDKDAVAVLHVLINRKCGD